jgi:hypothetical protein
LQRHYANTRILGNHAELLVATVCERLHYKRIKLQSHVNNHDVDVLAKHPSNKYWQANSVKNWQDPITARQVTEILEIAELARKRWKTREIRPAIVASYYYKNVIEEAGKRFGVNIASVEVQVAPLERRRTYGALNNELAFNFEITNEPTKLMMKNIKEYICKQPNPYSRTTSNS